MIVLSLFRNIGYQEIRISISVDILFVKVIMYVKNVYFFYFYIFIKNNRNFLITNEK